MDPKTPPPYARSFLPALEDREFLLREELRGLRFAMEYYKADLLLREWGVRSTVVVFGSARIPAPEAVEGLLAAAPDAAARAMVERHARLSVWYERARAFARLLSVRGGALTHRADGIRDNVVATGGGPGIMEAANRGAADVGAPSIGFNIGLPHEQEPNRWSTPSLTFSFHYFAMRKMHLAMRANALAVFPGGFGTLDEMFEILTLQQTGKAPPMPVVLFGRDYWTSIIRFEALVEQGMIAEADLGLFEIVDTPEEGWESIRRRGLVAHTPFQDVPGRATDPVDAE
ncbi:cytokinin riboside 5'-monophosphate phosphoribohydrolase [Allostella vacuolata]|nr:cytokinin riboside 5'-monophosphate phosphoribohydrolase [Stella vacuolata]